MNRRKKARNRKREGNVMGGGCRAAATGLLRSARRRLIIQLIMIRRLPAGTARLQMESLCSRTPGCKRWGHGGARARRRRPCARACGRRRTLAATGHAGGSPANRLYGRIKHLSPSLPLPHTHFPEHYGNAIN